MSTKWHKGPPPSVGWWPARVVGCGEKLGWWNGKFWSTFASPTDSADEAAEHAKSKGANEIEYIEWAPRPKSWPARSRT